MIELFLALTTHFASVDHNEVHPHVRYADEQIIAGAYYNSLDRVSLYAGLRHGGRYWIEYGAVTGYELKVAPMLRAGVKIKGNINIFIAPAYYDEGVNGLIGVEFKLW